MRSKRILTLTYGLFCIFYSWNANEASAQNIGINSTGANPHPSALLDVNAAPGNNKGLLAPRLTTIERLAIVNPANGLYVFDTNLNGFYYFSTTSNKWDCISNPAGTVQYFANANAPLGYLECNGQAVSRTIYPELFNAIGTLYGTGNGTTTFNVPDLRGEFIRGIDNGRGADLGRVLGTFQGDAIRNITGGVNGGAVEENNTAFGAIAISGYGQGASAPSGDNGWDFDASRVVPTANENRPRNIALLACIKY